MTAVNVRDGDRLRAPSTSDETAISFLDRLLSAVSPALAGVRLLDAGCGAGRRLSNTGAAVYPDHIGLPVVLVIRRGCRRCGC